MPGVETADGAGADDADARDHCPAYLLFRYRTYGPASSGEPAARVVRRRQAEVLLHLRVEELRHVGDGEPVVDQLLLELEAQDDVEVIGDLVRIDADQRRLHAVDRTPEGLLVDRAELARERL